MIIEIVLLVVTVYLAHAYVHGKDLSSKSFPPGPRGLPLIGHLPFLGNNPYETFAKLGKKFGNIFSIYLGPERVVVMNNSEDIREASKSNEFSGRPLVGFTTLWAKADTDKLHGIVFNQGPVCLELRRFSLRNLKNLGFGRKSMEDLVLHEVHEFVDLTLKAKVNEPTRISELFELAVVNSIWTLISGIRFKHDDPDLKSFVKQLTEDFAQVNSVGVASAYPKLAQKFPNYLGWNAIVNAIKNIRNFITTEVNKHKKDFDPDSPRDLIDIFLKEIHDAKDPKSIFYKDEGERNMTVVLMDLFGAGLETTTTALTWACFYLTYFPEIQKKFQKEIDKVVGRNRAPALPDKPNMPYVEATIQEVLRFSTFAPLLLLHSTMEDVEFRGYQIPKGTTVVLNAYSAMRDASIWKKPEEFLPERFLTSDGTFRNNEAFLAFGTGKRACLGENLARIQMFLFLTTIFQQFSLEFPEGQKKPSLEYSKPGIVLRPPLHHIILRERDTTNI